VGCQGVCGDTEKQREKTDHDPNIVLRKEKKKKKIKAAQLNWKPSDWYASRLKFAAKASRQP